MQTIELIIQTVLCTALFWTSFCRLTKTDVNTIREVRLAIWFEGVIALAVLGAPALPLLVPECNWPALTTPLSMWLSMLLASLLRVVASARQWSHGVPSKFVKSHS